MHARTGGPLVKGHSLFANFEEPDVRRHRPNIHHMGAEIQAVIEDAGELCKQHADILGAERHFEIEQLLDRQHIAMLHAHRRNIIEPIKIGQRLQIGLVLDQLFGAAMEQTDMRIDAFDDLAIQLHDHPQHAMGRRMLRAEVDRIVGNLDIADSGIHLVSLALNLFEIISHWEPPPHPPFHRLEGYNRPLPMGS